MDRLESAIWKGKINPLTNYLASEAIDFVAQRTFEHVHVIVKYRPAATVRSLAVEGVGHVGLRLLHGLLLVLQQHSWGHQLKEGYTLSYKNILKTFTALISLSNISISQE